MHPTTRQEARSNTKGSKETTEKSKKKGEKTGNQQKERKKEIKSDGEYPHLNQPRTHRDRGHPRLLSASMEMENLVQAAAPAHHQRQFDVWSAWQRIPTILTAYNAASGCISAWLAAFEVRLCATWLRPDKPNFQSASPLELPGKVFRCRVCPHVSILSLF